MKKKVLIILGVLLITIIIGLIIFVNINLGSVSKKSEDVEFTIEAGTNKVEIVSNLKKANLIKNEFATLIYVFFTPNVNMQAGTFKINRNETVKEIIKQISSGDTKMEKTITLTLVEGMRFTEYAKQISETFNIPYDDIINKCSDTTYLDSLIEKYWFIDDSIKNSSIYYPLEGYLYPDTYEFYENSTIEDIITKLLDNMDNKLTYYKDEINSSSYSVHELLTIASIAEKEALNEEDRKTVAQVIYKRLDIGMSLGMDVTSYYGVKKDLTDDITTDDLNAVNAYNTRNKDFIGLPVGPICSPSLESIDATLNPSNTDYIYFIADIKTGEVFFANSYEDFVNYKNDLGD